MMTKLSDTQLIILSKALAHEDGVAVLPPRANKAGAMRASASLIQKKLMREIRAKPGMPVWREDDNSRPLSLVITSAGRKAIEGEDASAQIVSASGGKSDAGPQTGVAASPKTADEAKTAGLVPAAKDQSEDPSPGQTKGVSPRNAAPREGKQALIIKMLAAEAGTTIDALIEATGWLPHTTRAALTGLRKRGFVVSREGRPGAASIYRVLKTDTAVAA